MELRQALQRIQSLYNKGVQSRDTRLKPRHIYEALISARSTVLRNQSNKNQHINQWSYQPLPCIEMINAPMHECPCAPSATCKILRSKFKLPKPITGLSSHLIQSVSSLDNNISFDPSSFNDVKYAAGAKYTAKKPQYYILNGYLYLTNKTMLKAVYVSMLAQDPLAVALFPLACQEVDPCIDIMTTDFPIDKDQGTPIFQLAANELIAGFAQMKEDRSNNRIDEAGASGGMVHQPQQQD